MKDKAYIDIHHHKQNVATIEFFTPKANSMSSSMLLELAHHITSISRDPSIKVIVLQSQGHVFCSGASFDELKTIKNNEDSKRFFSGFAKVILSMIHSPKFILAKVQGKAVGGGVGILSAADYVIAADTAQFRLSEMRIGIGPFVIEPAVSRRIGALMTQHMTYNPTLWFDAKWALAKGMIDETVPPEELSDRIDTKSTEIAQYSAQALAENKAMFLANTHHWEGLFEIRAAKSGQLLTQDYCQQFLNSN